MVAVLAVTAPTANAGKERKLTASLHLDQLRIGDRFLSQACGTNVEAWVTGDVVWKLEPGTDRNPMTRVIQTFDGDVTWFVEETGKT